MSGHLWRSCLVTTDMSFMLCAWDLTRIDFCSVWVISWAPTCDWVLIIAWSRASNAYWYYPPELLFFFETSFHFLKQVFWYRCAAVLSWRVRISFSVFEILDSFWNLWPRLVIAFQCMNFYLNLIVVKDVALSTAKLVLGFSKIPYSRLNPVRYVLFEISYILCGSRWIAC